MSFFEKGIEFVSMVKIALSPIIVFTVIAAGCYVVIGGNTGVFVAVGIFVLGLIIGIGLAIRVHRKHGASEFESRVMATPELDKKDKKEQ